MWYFYRGKPLGEIKKHHTMLHLKELTKYLEVIKGKIMGWAPIMQCVMFICLDVLIWGLSCNCNI